MKCKVCKKERPSIIEEMPTYFENHIKYVQDVAAFCRSLNDWCLDCFKDSDLNKSITKKMDAVGSGFIFDHFGLPCGYKMPKIRVPDNRNYRDYSQE